MLFLMVISPLSLLKAVVPLLLLAMLIVNSSQLITLLLSLELFVCLFYHELNSSLYLELSAYSLSLVFMCIMVCEAMLGIGVLILTVRNKGNNFLNLP